MNNPQEKNPINKDINDEDLQPGEDNPRNSKNDEPQQKDGDK